MTGRHLFIADTHFGHTSAALHHSRRPFDTIEEHDKYLIESWNSVVGPQDTIWHLGDFAHDRAEPKELNKIFVKLNGSKHLIAGNHDKKHVKELPWSSVRDYAELGIDGQRLVLSHYPMKAWNALRHGSVQLFGHCHGRMPMNRQQADVGVDTWQFLPVDFATIKAHIETLPEIVYAEDSDEWTLADAPGMTL